MTTFVVAILVGISYAKAKPNILVFFTEGTQYTSHWSESAPNSYLNSNHTIVYESFDTPGIDRIRKEGIILPRSYATSPMCSSARYSILTGKYSSKNNNIMSNGIHDEFGTRITMKGMQVTGNDYNENIQTILQNNGYKTGMSGKYHLYTDLGKSQMNETVYNECVNDIKSSGFDFVDGLYMNNIPETDMKYSHNPEWMVSTSIDFINKTINEDNEPFFLFFAPTLTHRPNNYDAMFNFDINTTPKGHISFKNYMKSRDELWDKARNTYIDDDKAKKAVGYYWLDNSLQALMEYIEDINELDNTIIIVMNDHGVGCETAMFEQGIRVFDFIRYPRLFRHQIYTDTLISQVDIMPTLLDIINVINDEYTMDGISILNNLDHIPDVQYRFFEFEYSKGLIYYDIQNHIMMKYIWHIKSPNYGQTICDEYPNANVTGEQLYDLIGDPSEQVNVVSFPEYNTILQTLRPIMIQFIDDNCPTTNCNNIYPPTTIIEPSNEDDRRRLKFGSLADNSSLSDKKEIKICISLLFVMFILVCINVYIQVKCCNPDKAQIDFANNAIDYDSDADILY